MLVENAIDQRLERGLRSLIAQGLRAEDIKRMDLSKLRDGQREGALRDVRANLLLEKIADLEGIRGQRRGSGPGDCGGGAAVQAKPAGAAQAA